MIFSSASAWEIYLGTIDPFSVNYILFERKSNTNDKITNSRWDWKTSDVSLLQIPFPKYSRELNPLTGEAMFYSYSKGFDRDNR